MTGALPLSWAFPVFYAVLVVCGLIRFPGLSLPYTVSVHPVWGFPLSAAPASGKPP